MASQKLMNDELTAFVLSLTPEEASKILSHLPELISLLLAEGPPSPQEPSPQSA